MFLAGQKIRASELNDRLAAYAFKVGDQSVTNSTTLVAVTTLVIPLEANEQYALDGMINYDAGATGDFKAALTVPTGTTGSWGLYGPSTASTGSVGDINATRLDAFGTGNTIAIGGAAAGAIALPRGTLVTTTAGNLQLHFAQNTSNGTATILKAGSWLRAMKILTS